MGVHSKTFLIKRSNKDQSQTCTRPDIHILAAYPVTVARPCLYTKIKLTYSFPTQEATKDQPNTTICCYLFAQQAHAASASIFQAVTHEKTEARFIARGNLQLESQVMAWFASRCTYLVNSRGNVTRAMSKANPGHLKRSRNYTSLPFPFTPVPKAPRQEQAGHSCAQLTPGRLTLSSVTQA